jgi:signal transduction histidine kinase/ligand-binding sensor domain-containing protein
MVRLMDFLIGVRLPRTTARAARVALLCLSVVVSGSAADERTFHVRMWTTDDGLPHNSASGVLQDSAGFMWLATVGGLARFDGREFREMRPPPEHRALGFNIHGLAEERPGTLLVLPTGGTVLRLTGSTWSVHPATSVLADLHETPVDVHVDARGNVWITTAAGRLLRWSADGQSKMFGPDEGMVSRSRNITLADDVAGGVWIAADSLLGVDATGAFVRHASASIEPRRIATGRNGRVWAWTDRHVLQLEGGRVIREFDVPLPGDIGTIRDLFEDGTGTIWIATSRRGLFSYGEGSVKRVGAFSSVLFVTEDREGNIWIATDGNGVGQLREKNYRVFNTANGLAQDVVSSICEDPDGRVWLANRSGGLVEIGPDGLAQRRGPGGPRAFANALCTDAENRLWFGGGRNGLLRWDPKKPDTLVQLPAPQTNLHLLFRAKNGDLWFAGDPGLVGFYRGDDLHTLTAADGFVPQEVRAIAQDRAGDIWLGGRSGELLRWDGRQIERFDAPRGFPHELIHAIWVDASDRLWIGTAGGLVLKDNDHFRILTEANGLADDIIQQILEDDQGCLWFAARRGLFYAKTSDLLATARGENPRVESHRLGPSEGLVGLSPTANYYPAACKTRDGWLWFATAQGAVAVDPARLPRSLPPPPVLIDEVHLDGQLLPLGAALRIPSGQHRIQFRFAALSYTAPESVILRHQLEGADPQWIDTGSDRMASYTNLPPKAYRLRVIARNSAGRWNAEGATLAFTVVPAWWETLGFRLGAVALLTGVTALLARSIAQRRLRHRLLQLEQEHALEKERMRIARDLHDDLGARLTEVGLLAERLIEDSPSEITPRLSGLARRTRRLATELSSIVWTMNAANSSLDRLAGFLRRFAERVFRDTGISCVVTGVDAIPAIPLPPDPQHQLLAAAKEAMNNILKHARATEACLEMHYTDGVFELRIIDNGAGFTADATSMPEGNGLRNMHTRMAEIGGTLEISSGPGMGTKVIFRLPCSARDSIT